MRTFFYQFGAFFFILSFWMSCNNKQGNALKKGNDVKAVEYAETIIVGHAGGITGAATQYIIEGNGQVTKTYGMPAGKVDSTTMSKLEVAQLKQLHEGLDSLKLKEVTFNHSGNMNWFITIEQGDSLQHTILWGVPNEKKIAPNIKTYHNTVLEWVQQMENKQ